jgi:hypothetical protein
MKRMTVEIEAPEFLPPAAILRAISKLGGEGRITARAPAPIEDAAQMAFEWESILWQCAGCLHVLNFACSVTAEALDACPRCRSREFRIA